MTSATYGYRAGTRTLGHARIQTEPGAWCFYLVFGVIEVLLSLGTVWTA